MLSKPRIRVTTADDGMAFHLPVKEEVSKSTPSVQTKATFTQSVRTPVTSCSTTVDASFSSSPQDSSKESRSRSRRRHGDHRRHKPHDQEHSDSQEESSAAPTLPSSPLGIIIETKTADQAVAVPAVVIHETTVASSSLSPKKNRRNSSHSRSTTPRRNGHYSSSSPAAAASTSLSKSSPHSSSAGRLLNVDSYSVVDVASVPNDLGVEAENSVSLIEANSIFVVGRQSKHKQHGREESSSVAVSNSRSPPNVPQEIIPLDNDEEMSTMSGNPYPSASLIATAQGSQRLSPTRLLRNYLSGNKGRQQSHPLQLHSQQSPSGSGMFPNDYNDVELGFPSNNNGRAVPMEVMLSPEKIQRDLRPMPNSMPHSPTDNNNNKSMVKQRTSSICET
eukprot:scaffold116893_cov43-Attheya_sp.AAC.1